MFVKLDNAKDLREILEGMKASELRVIFLRTSCGKEITGLRMAVNVLSDGSETVDMVFTTQ